MPKNTIFNGYSRCWKSIKGENRWVDKFDNQTEVFILQDSVMIISIENGTGKPSSNLSWKFLRLLSTWEKYESASVHLSHHQISWQKLFCLWHVRVTAWGRNLGRPLSHNYNPGSNNCKYLLHWLPTLAGSLFFFFP